MAGKPIATKGSMHVCPMVTGTTPHVGGPVIGPGSPNVLINGKPAALMGDMVACAGPPDTIAQGEPTVLINGTPVATQGCLTAHGGSITVGEPTVLVGSGASSPKSTLKIKEIPFPKIDIFDHLGALARGKSKDLKQAKEKQEELKEESQKNKIELSELVWKKDEAKISKVSVGEVVCLCANVSNAEEGDYLPLKIYEKDEQGADDYVDSVMGVVNDSRITIEWKVKYVEDNDDVESAKELQERNFTLPEYVFKYCNPNSEDVESNVLEVVDVLEVKFIDGESGEPVPNLNFAISLPDGTFIEGVLDEDGYAKVEEIRASENYPIVFYNEEGPILTANS